MATRPFRVVGKLPRPLTVEETATRFGVSMAVVDAARRVLMTRSGHLATMTRTRKASSAARASSRKRAWRDDAALLTWLSSL
jgi:hypothetical protein